MTFSIDFPDKKNQVELQGAGMLPLIVVCTIDATGGKEEENNKKSRQNKTPGLDKATGKGSAQQRDTNKPQVHVARKDKGNTFVTKFIADMQELENESSHDEQQITGCLNNAAKYVGEMSLLVNLRKASQQVRESTPESDNSQAANKLTEHHSPKVQRIVNHGICSSREAILSASPYTSLFTTPEHCTPKRKEAIERSASKVAEWLYTNNVSSTLDAQESCSDEGTMDVESVHEGERDCLVRKQENV